MKRVLVTNDDGIDAEGIRVLTAALVAGGYEPLVVAPNADYSGAGTSLLSRDASPHTGTNREVAYQRRTLAEAPDVEAYAIAAPPAMCALLTMRGAFGRAPDCVASGINWGLNTGGAVRHSGTVSAATTGAAFGVPAIAVSAEFDSERPEEPLRYDTAATIGVKLLGLLADSEHQMLNINVPMCGIEELAGVAPATVSQVSRYRSYVADRDDEVLKLGYMVSDDEVEPTSDTGLVMAGFAAVTSLAGVSSIDCSALVNRLAGQAA